MSAVARVDEIAAARELLRRRRARASLEDYAQAIDVPGRPAADDPDGWIFQPVESALAQHHRVILRGAQQCMTTRYGRLMIFAPPGSAKSSYASVVAPTWYVGKFARTRVILTSYATGIASKQSRRARQICRSADYRSIFNTSLPQDQSASDDWALSNGSEFMAAGILAGVTGNRAHGLVIDDPVAGREEADSQTMQKKTLDAYQDDLLTRLVPGAWVILMMTRWHQSDLAGALLPDDYDGRSGPVRCRDGMVWNVLRIPACADSDDDPIGRKPGEYLWPEWFDERHWRIVQDNPSPAATRSWAALYQQKPAPDAGILFKREWFQWYDPQERPANLRRYMASDFAVTQHGGDYTEHGVIGIDADLHVWGVDWYAGQEASDTTIQSAIDLIAQHRPTLWLGERGVIEKALGPAIDAAMVAAKTYAKRQLLPTIGDKVARAQAFRGLCEAGRFHLPRGAAWAERLVDQLVSFPAGTHDDGVDVCGLIGRAVNQLARPQASSVSAKRAPVPFTEEWFDRQPDAEEKARRARYYR